MIRIKFEMGGRLVHGKCRHRRLEYPVDTQHFCSHPGHVTNSPLFGNYIF